MYCYRPSGSAIKLPLLHLAAVAAPAKTCFLPLHPHSPSLDTVRKRFTGRYTSLMPCFSPTSALTPQVPCVAKRLRVRPPPPPSEYTNHCSRHCSL
ncbi:hypothetical protein C8R43DRAFT_427606 [Mycena crocata]|nr:hypothetical protein C8R43DRAFT_427606 [Mycena crocata]